MKLTRNLGLLLVATATFGAGAAAVATAATTTTTAAPAVTAPAPGGKHWHHRGGGMLVGVMLRATHQLNLTTEQRTSIKGILSTARAQHKAQTGSASFDLTALANPGDPNYATALQNAKAAAAARFQNEVELQGQIYNVLTADQKAKLPQVLADMKTRMEQRRATWMQQHGAAPEAAGSN